MMEGFAPQLSRLFKRRIIPNVEMVMELVGPFQGVPRVFEDLLYTITNTTSTHSNPCYVTIFHRPSPQS